MGPSTGCQLPSRCPTGGYGLRGRIIRHYPYKVPKSGQPGAHNSEGKKIQLYSFLEAETAAYVSSICFLNFPRSNRVRILRMSQIGFLLCMAAGSGRSWSRRIYGGTLLLWYFAAAHVKRVLLFLNK